MPNTGNTQQIINYGATANDGQGDPLRTAFIKTDENFDNIWLAGPVGSNITITNNTIQVNNTNGNLVLKPNGVGIIQHRNHSIPWINDVYDLGAANLRWRNIYANNMSFANLEVSSDLVVQGNLTVYGDTIQIGNITTDTLTIQLANTAATDAAANGAGITVGANDDIATLLYDAGNNVWTTNIGIQVGGPITGTSISVSDATIYGNLNGMDAIFTGNVTANYFFGDGSGITNVDAVTLNGAVGAVPATPDTLVLRDGSGNVTANSFIGDGSQLTGFANVAFTGSYVDLTGSPTNVSQFTNDSGYITTATANVISVNGQTGVVSLSIPTATSDLVNDSGFIELANLSVTTANASGNGALTYNNLTGEFTFTPADAAASNYGDGNVTNLLGNFGSNAIVTSGNITGGYILGNGSQLTGLPAGYANANAVSYAETGWGGNIIPQGNLVYNLGNSTNRWNDLYLSGNTIYLDSATIQTNSGYITIGSGDGSGLLIGAGGALFNADNSDFVIYGNLSDPGTSITIPSNDSIANGVALAIVNQQSNVEITAVGNTWTFDDTGNLTAPGNVVANTFVATEYNVLTAGNLLVTSQYGLGVTGTILEQDGTLELIGNGSGCVVVGWNSSYGNLGPVAQMYFNPAGDSGNIVVTTGNTAGTSHTWTFGDNGNTTFPGNSTLTTSEGAFLTTKTFSGNAYTQQNQDTNTWELYSEDDVTGPNPAWAWIKESLYTVDTPEVFIENKKGSDGVAYRWTFDANGNLTLPSDTANINYANGVSILDGIGSSYGDANVATFLADLGSNAISTTGNVTAQNFIGNISVTGNITGTSANVDIIAGSYQWTFNNTGNLVLPGNAFTVNYANGTQVTLGGGGGGTPGGSDTQIQFNDGGSFGGDSGFTYNKATDAVTVVGNIAGGNITTAGLITATGNIISAANVIGGNMTTAGLVSAGGNVVGANLNTGGLITATGNIQGGNLLTGGVISATGNITGSYFLGNGSQLTGIATLSFTTVSANGTSLVADSTTDTLTLTSGNNLVITGTAGTDTATFAVSDAPTFTGNVTGGNFLTSGLVSATGNVTGGNIIGTLVSPGSNTQVLFNDANVIAGNASLTFTKTSGNLNLTGNLVATQDLWTATGNLRTTGGTGNIFNFSATTINIGGAATTINMGNSAGTITLSGNVQGNTNGFAIGYRDIPQVTFSANATIALSDAGKHYYSTSASNLVMTIANSATANFAVGAAINLINQGTGTITVAQGSGVTMYFAGNSTSSNRTVASYGVATIQKVATDTWFIVGVGIT